MDGLGQYYDLYAGLVLDGLVSLLDGLVRVRVHAPHLTLTRPLSARETATSWLRSHVL